MGLFLEETEKIVGKKKIIDPAAERKNEKERKKNLKTPTYGKLFGILSMLSSLFFQENFEIPLM